MEVMLIDFQINSYEWIPCGCDNTNLHGTCNERKMKPKRKLREVNNPVRERERDSQVMVCSVSVSLTRRLPSGVSAATAAASWRPLNIQQVSGFPAVTLIEHVKV
jgi:hypothetical protein